MALKNFGSKSKEKDNGQLQKKNIYIYISLVTRVELTLCSTDVSMVIHREGKSLAYGQVEKGYEEWVLKMHKSYDEEDALGEDEATVIFDSLDKKALCISPDCEGM